MIFSTPTGETAVCSDCIKIFMKRVRDVENDYTPRFTQTRQ